MGKNIKKCHNVKNKSNKYIIVPFNTVLGSDVELLYNVSSYIYKTLTEANIMANNEHAIISMLDYQFREFMENRLGHTVVSAMGQYGYSDKEKKHIDRFFEQLKNDLDYEFSVNDSQIACTTNSMMYDAIVQHVDKEKFQEALRRQHEKESMSNDMRDLLEQVGYFTNLITCIVCLLIKNRVFLDDIILLTDYNNETKLFESDTEGIEEYKKIVETSDVITEVKNYLNNIIAFKET